MIENADVMKDLEPFKIDTSDPRVLSELIESREARLTKLLSLGAPRIMIENERRMVREARGALLVFRNNKRKAGR